MKKQAKRNAEQPRDGAKTKAKKVSVADLPTTCDPRGGGVDLGDCPTVVAPKVFDGAAALPRKTGRA